MRARLVQLLPRPPDHPAAHSLALAALIDWTGTGLWLTVSTLFFTRVVGLRPLEIGVGLAAAGAAGMVAVMPVTSLTARWPAAPVALVLQVCRGLTFLAYLGVDSAPTFIGAAVLVAVVDRPASSVLQVLVGRVVPEEQRGTTMASLHVAQNVGIAAGAALGSLALLRSDRASFDAVVLADAASFLVAAWLIARMARRSPERVPPAQTAPPRLPRRLRVPAPARDARFALLTAGNGLLALHMPLLNVVTPLWLARETRAPATLMGGLYLVNTALVVGLQLPVARSVGHVKGGVRGAWTAGACIAACGAALALAALAPLAGAAGLLVLAAVLLTLAEVHQNAAAWVLSFARSPSDRRQPAYLGFFGTGQAVIVVLGPALLTLLISSLGIWAFAITAGLVLAGALCVTAGTGVDRRLRLHAGYAWEHSTWTPLRLARRWWEAERPGRVVAVVSAGAGGTPTLAYCGIMRGLTTSLPALETLRGGPVERIERRLTWRRLRTADLADLIATGCGSARAARQPAGTLVLPFRVRLVVPVEDRPHVSRQARKEFAHARRLRGWTCERDETAEGFALFYDRMHVPTMRRRHGVLARSERREAAEECLLRHGFVLFVAEGGARLAGGLCRWDARSRTVTLRLVGVLDGDPAHYRSGALKAVYHLLLEWAAQQGAALVDLSVADPFPALGVVQWKLRFHPRLELPSNHLGDLRLCLRPVRDTAPVRDFLVANPVVAMAAGGGLEGLRFFDRERPARTGVPLGFEGLAGVRNVDLDDLLRAAASTRRPPR